MICLQIFNKHAKHVLVYLTNNTTASYTALKNAFGVEMSVFVLVCVTPPTDSLPNSISTPRIVSWWKTQRIAAMEAMYVRRYKIRDIQKKKKNTVCR